MDRIDYMIKYLGELRWQASESASLVGDQGQTKDIWERIAKMNNMIESELDQGQPDDAGDDELINSKWATL